MKLIVKKILPLLYILAFKPHCSFAQEELLFNVNKNKSWTAKFESELEKVRDNQKGETIENDLEFMATYKLNSDYILLLGAQGHQIFEEYDQKPLKLKRGLVGTRIFRNLGSLEWRVDATFNFIPNGKELEVDFRGKQFWLQKNVLKYRLEIRNVLEANEIHLEKHLNGKFYLTPQIKINHMLALGAENRFGFSIQDTNDLYIFNLAPMIEFKFLNFDAKFRQIFDIWSSKTSQNSSWMETATTNLEFSFEI